jgi:predicted outer membrane repeat protein
VQIEASQIDNNYTILISGCYFQLNEASSRGGALYIAWTQGNVNNNTFSKNKARDGGAIYYEEIGRLELFVFLFARELSFLVHKFIINIFKYFYNFFFTLNF